MNTADIQNCLIEKASAKASKVLEVEYIPKRSLCEYLEHIEKESLYKESVAYIYSDYINYCNKGIKPINPMNRTAFSRAMVQCGFRIKPIKKNKKVVRCFYW